MQNKSYESNFYDHFRSILEAFYKLVFTSSYILKKALNHEF